MVLEAEEPLELIEKLTGFQLVKKFPVFNGIRRLLTVLTSARHLYPEFCEVFVTRYGFKVSNC
jgi:hypothetical protein